MHYIKEYFQAHFIPHIKKLWTILFLALSSSSFASHHIADSLATLDFANKNLLVKSIRIVAEQEPWLNEAGINLKKIIGKPANQTLIDDVLKKFVTYNEDNGYPFARAQFVNVQADSSFFSAELQLSKGNFIIIDSLVVNGESRVRPRFLQNHLSLRKPRAYSENYVKNVDQRINDIIFLNTSEPSAVEFRSQSARLYTYVNDAKANRANGLLAFGNDDNGKFQLRGEVSLFIANMFKGGEQLSLDWSNPESNVQTLSVGINIPYIFFGTVGALGTFDMERHDTLYTNLSGKFGLTSRVGAHGNASLFIEIQDFNNTTVETENADVRHTLYGIDYQIRKTNDILFPRSGYSIYLALAAGTRNVTVESDKEKSTSIESAADVSYHFSFAKRASILARTQAKVKNAFVSGSSQTLFQSEQYSIGGANSLRGFNERSIFTPAFAIGTLEPRFFYNAQGYLFAFYDYAIMSNSGTSRKDNVGHFHSLGLGTRFASGVGIFSISYALGAELGKTLMMKNTKVHVSYTAVF